MSKKRNKVCGIDVHKRFLVASILDNEGNCETKRFEQDLDELISFKNWILDSGCESVAMEFTAEYWRPAYGILNPEINITIGNAYHMKGIPGKKTDVLDSQWIAELELNNLITPSRVFTGDLYELRTLTRARNKMVNNSTVFKNKILHQLDVCSIRLCTVLKDVFGKSGYALLKGIVERKTQDEIIKALPAKTRKIAPVFFEQIPEYIPDSAIFLIDSMLKIYDNLQVEIKRIEERIKFYLKDKENELRILMSVPGIGIVIGSNLLAEIGDIHDFPTADKLVKWAGLTPSVYQSANTNYTGPITKQRSKYLRWALIEAAHSAIRRPGKLNDYFNGLLPRKGYKKAIVAVARKILRIVWHLLINNEIFEDGIPRVKTVKIPKFPEKIERVGIAKIIQLLSRGAEIIVQEEGKEIMRINSSCQPT